MSEFEDKGCKVIGHEKRVTSLGVVVRSDVQTGDATRTVYHSTALTEYGVIQQLKSIEAAESLIADRPDLLHLDTDLETHLNNLADGFVTEVREGKWLGVHEYVTFPIAEQRVLHSLFDQSISS